MSRDIDFTKPLTADDISYIRARPWLEREAAINGADLNPEETLGATYADMTVKHLQAELTLRQLPNQGNKQELVDRLVADDQDTSDEDESEVDDDEEEELEEEDE